MDKQILQRNRILLGLPPENKSAGKDLLSILDGIKQYILAAAGGLYALGLLSWSVYSYKSNLGHITSFDVQYFVTGIVPALMILYFIWYFKNRPAHSKLANAWLAKHPDLLHFFKLFFWVILYIYLADIFFFKGKIFSYIGNVLPSPPSWVIAIMVFILLNFLFLFNSILQMLYHKGESKNVIIGFLYTISNLYVALYVFLLKIFMFLLPVILISFYFEDLYPNIPMELGGVKPKKSILMLAPADFEKSDRIAIFKNQTDTTVAKSDTLMVYFYNDSKIIFKIKNEADTKGRSARAFEIERGKVNSIQWLGDH